jgi:group I intron endonuclease
MQNRKIYIYKITNPKGKIYIGSTVNLKDRIYRYKTYRVKAQIKIYNSLIKYTFENHKFEVIYECNESDRNYYESYYGELFDVIGENGLNLSIPKSNEKYITMSNETKKKIGNAHRGKIISDSQKESMACNLKKYRENNPNPMKGKEPWNKGKIFLVGEKNPMYGIKRSEEWKINHSKLIKQRTKRGSEHFKSKVVLDLFTGIFYDSIKEVSIYNNIIYSTLKSKINKNKEFRFKII